jgi:sn-glycerol 3-phosphate transport system substrate-binding protein
MLGNGRVMKSTSIRLLKLGFSFHRMEPAMKFALSALAALVGLVGMATEAGAAIRIDWWHAMLGANNDVIEDLAEDFNESQTSFQVVPVFKGTYPEALRSGLDAYRAGRPPHIIQVFDAGTGVMMREEAAVIAVSEVMKSAGRRFDESRYLPGIAAYYSRPDGAMLSFPLNSSSPILFYNKDVFARAGLDVNAPPTTWPEVWAVAREIVESGAATCGYTSSWLTWIHLENFAAWNNLSYATQGNGLAGNDIELLINAPIFVEHMQDIADLSAEGVFRYGGRTSEAKQLFLSGECGILTDSSGGLGDAEKSNIDYGTGPLPYEPEAVGAPQNTVPGGASLWVFAGHPAEEYEGVAAFLDFLSQTDVQSRLHQVSGYLPITMAAYEATKASGFYEENPGREQPILQMIGKPPTENSRGIRAVNLPELRDIQNEEFETMLVGDQTAQEALDNAVARGNAAIRAALGN